MKSRTLIAVAVAALAAVLLAIWLQGEPGPGEPGRVVLPELAPQLNQLTALVIEPAGGEPFRLVHDAEGWRAPAKGGYPVDAGKVRRLLLRLAEARVLETKTANPELHDRLGLEMTGGQAGSGVLLALEGADRVPQLLIGQVETRGLQGTYLRTLDEPTALLVDQQLQPERTVLDWLERDLLDTPPEDIASLEILHTDGEALRIDRDELGVFRLTELPDGYRASSPAAADSLARALSALRLDDVRSRQDWSPEEPPVRAIFRLRDGVVIEASTWAVADEGDVEDHWTAFAVRQGPDEANTVPEAAAESVRSLHSRLEPWLFKLPVWKREQLTRRQGDLLIPAED